MQRFGEKLRTLREQQKVSLRQLAIELGFASHSHITNIEAGRKKPSAELALRIARFFGVTVDQMLDDELEVE